MVLRINFETFILKSMGLFIFVSILSFELSYQNFLRLTLKHKDPNYQKDDFIQLNFY